MSIMLVLKPQIQNLSAHPRYIGINQHYEQWVDFNSSIDNNIKKQKLIEQSNDG